jgi:hypothetical protein
LSKVVINLTGTRGTVEVDGQELKGVTGLSVTARPGHLPLVYIIVIADDLRVFADEACVTTTSDPLGVAPDGNAAG